MTINFLYGNDSFRIRERLKDFPNAIKIDDLSNIKNSSLFFRNETFLIEVDKDFILPEKFFSHNNLVFYYPNPDKRTKIFKDLLKIAKPEEFNELNGKQLISWILENYNISPEAASLVTIYIGTDLWRVKNELDIVNINIGCEKIISDSDIKRTIKPKIDSSIWNLESGNIKVILERLAQGDDERYLLNMLIWYFRNLIKIKIGQTSVLHAFVIKKNQPIADRYSIEKLKIIYQGLLQIDFWQKIGLIERPATFFWLLYSF